MKAALSGIKGETVDVGIFGDIPEIANVSGAIFECLTGAGVLINRFSPLGSGIGVRGILVGVSPDASAAVKSAADSLIKILRETLGSGVGQWEFAKLNFKWVRNGRRRQ